jgi:hypothetical protein
MFSNFKALLVAGVALPALVGVAFAQGVTTTNSVSPSAPSIKSDTTIATPSVKADTKVAPAVDGKAVDAKKAVTGKTSEIAPKSDATKMSTVKQDHLKKQNVQKTDAVSGAAAGKIARSPAAPPKAGDVATPGTAAQKL